MEGGFFMESNTKARLDVLSEKLLRRRSFQCAGTMRAEEYDPAAPKLDCRLCSDEEIARAAREFFELRDRLGVPSEGFVPFGRCERLDAALRAREERLYTSLDLAKEFDREVHWLDRLAGLFNLKRPEGMDGRGRFGAWRTIQDGRNERTPVFMYNERGREWFRTFFSFADKGVAMTPEVLAVLDPEASAREPVVAEPAQEADDELGVEMRDGKIVVSSRQIARAFGKEHRDVLKSIRSLDCSEKFNARNFALVEYLDVKGEKRPEYLLSRDGFAFLAMGFTGKRAAQFKEAYIERFNEMEEALRARTAPRELPAPESGPRPTRRPARGKRLFSPEEAAEALGYQGFRSFYAAMMAAGFFVRSGRGRIEPKPEFVRQGLFVLKMFRSGVDGCNKWRRPMTTEAGIMYLRRLAEAV